MAGLADRPTGARLGCAKVTAPLKLRLWRLVLVSMAGISVAVPAPPASAQSAPPAARGSWQSYSTSNSTPPARQDAAMAYDAASNQLILFGGKSATGALLEDTWVWSGKAWQQLQPETSPPPLAGPAMAYDSQLRELILFGGATGSPPSPTNGTWAWNGGSWVPLDLSAGGSSIPPARSDAALAASGGEFVLFGGVGAAGAVLGDTWTFNGSTWTQQTPATAPPGRSAGAATWDSSTNQVLLYGGQDASGNWLGDTWTWDGSNWSARGGAAPPARADAALAYDGDVGADILIGGVDASGPLSDTWMFDTAAWSPESTADSPPARYGAAAAWDQATHQLVIFGGGTAGGAVLGDTYTLSPESHPPATTTTSKPPARSAPSTTTTSPPATASAPPSTAAPHRRHSAPTTVRRSASRSPGMAPARRRVAVPPAAIRTGPSHVHQGETVTVTGSGFAPGTPVSLSFHSHAVPLGTVRADSAGEFRARVTVPADAAVGAHHVDAVGRLAGGSLQVLATPLEVMYESPTQRPLWETLSMVALALLIPLATWVILDLRSRRRRRVAVTR
jgi:hypothetical protein